ncbi:uncharacterized protein An07g04147 [Aspergillus niger]|uniref:Contig An07c0100, genomic contig n=2 Tax=Aspergillus niger TaxID=5061 RepID=A2QN24_ASPNC|nr:uncharacterized protein An07g04147 [Aspergillus niger]CAK48165.1 unnamed protein product [Aspergillus niger]
MSPVRRPNGGSSNAIRIIITHGQRQHPPPAASAIRPSICLSNSIHNQAARVGAGKSSAPSPSMTPAATPHYRCSSFAARPAGFSPSYLFFPPRLSHFFSLFSLSPPSLFAAVTSHTNLLPPVPSTPPTPKPLSFSLSLSFLIPPISLSPFFTPSLPLSLPLWPGYSLPVEKVIESVSGSVEVNNETHPLFKRTGDSIQEKNKGLFSPSSPSSLIHLRLFSKFFRSSHSHVELSSLPHLPDLLKDVTVSFVCDLLNAGSDLYTLHPSLTTTVDKTRSRRDLFLLFSRSKSHITNPGIPPPL